MSIQLTKDDVLAIRNATRFGVTIKSDRAVLHVVREIKPRTAQGFDIEGTEARKEINVNQETRKEASFFVLYPAGEWQALRLLIKAGDELYVFARENGNDYLRYAEIPAGKIPSHYHTSYDRLYHDQLCVSLVRNGKTIIRELVLAYSITPDNLARSIRPAAA